MQKHKVFISHYKGDRTEVDKFIQTFAQHYGVFTPYVLGAGDNDDFINSTDTDYVMSQIRKKYLQDTTVTIVLVGSCTHSRRYVDWEIKSSLRQGEQLPNGLLAIALPSQGNSAYLPPRFIQNWKEDGSGYAKFYSYPTSPQMLANWIENAYQARFTKAHLISNCQEMMKYNACCKVCRVTH